MSSAIQKSLLFCALCAGINPALAGNIEPGFKLSIEAMYGHHTAPSIDSGSYAPSLVDTPWVNGETDIKDLWGGKLTGAWTFISAQGRAYQFGLTYTGWEGNKSISDPAYGSVFFEPGLSGGNPIGEITVCQPETTCTNYKSRVRREYWELMPEIQMQLGGSYWLGLKPFWGDLDESSYAYSKLSTNLRVDNDLDGQARGLLLSGKKDFSLTESVEVSINAAVGPYEISVDSHTEGSRGGVVKDSKNINGVRGQLGVEGKLALTRSLSLNASMLMDYWSKQPFYTGGYVGDWGGQPVCTRPGPGNALSCIPPRAVGNYNISTESTRDLFFGLGLAYQF